MKQRIKHYYWRNRKERLAYQKEYDQINKEKIKEYNQINKEKIKKYKAEWFQKSKDRLRKKHNEYIKQRYHSDDLFNTKERLRARLKEAIQRFTDTKKIRRARDYGIDFDSIIKQLGNRPAENYHIDHIKPLSSFNLNNPNEIKRAFAPENLRWLPAKENLVKSDKLG